MTTTNPALVVPQVTIIGDSPAFLPISSGHPWNTQPGATSNIIYAAIQNEFINFLNYPGNPQTPAQMAQIANQEIGEYFFSLNKNLSFPNTSLPFPTTLDALATGVANQFDADFINFGLPLLGPDTIAAIKSAFISEYESFVGYKANDLSILGVSEQDIDLQALNGINYFLQNYPFSSVGKLGPLSSTAGTGGLSDNSDGQSAAIQDFFNNFYNFLEITATLQSSTTLTSSSFNSPVTITGSGVFSSYEQVYLNFGFPASGFQSALQQFYQDQLTSTGNGNPDNGFFIPSQAFNAWQNQLLSQRSQELHNILTTPPPVFDKVSVDTDPQKKLVVIDNILVLLIEMINSIYDIASSQSATLTLYTTWQSKYNDLLQQIPVFLANTKNPLASTDPNSDVSKARGDMVNYNQGLNENVQAKSSILQDNAKSLQANLNQSQDAASQQANIATTILQDLNSIVSTIFPG